MSPTQILVIAIIVLVVIAVVAGIWFLSRGRGLRRKFGPEYDRVLAESPTRAAAEQELRERERRHAELDIKDLAPETRDAYIGQWRSVQAHFIDAPAEAVNEADILVTRLVAEMGYPTEDYDEQVAQLSVDHARPLPAYREAHEIHLRARNGGADTEELRRALVRYRALVTELLGKDADADGSNTTRSPKSGRRHSHA